MHDRIDIADPVRILGLCLSTSPNRIVILVQASSPTVANINEERVSIIMADEQDYEEYTLDEAVSIIEKTIERKTSEIEALKKKAPRLKNVARIKANEAMIAYMEADIAGYKTVIADMTDDPSYSEDVDLDSEPVPVPDCYQDYIDGLSADDLENELDSESIRADYCDDIVQEMCLEIGQTALGSKKMLKALLDDPFALEQIGEVIFYDDYLYDLLKTIAESDGEKSKKKKKKKKD